MLSENEEFTRLEFTKTKLPEGRFEEATFSHCIFTRADLRDRKFMDCTFDHCDLSLANVVNTSFQSVVFNNCKIQGVLFQELNPLLFAAEFLDCQLSLSSFPQLDLRKCVFEKCILREVDFFNANLSGVSLDHCDLERAIFDGTDLRKTDFTTAFNFKIDPANNIMKQAKFSRSTIDGLLSSFELKIM